jgi:tetratricopeptide (TPR) repeat protein
MISYLRPDGEKPVLNEKAELRFIETRIDRIFPNIVKTKPEQPEPEKTEKPAAKIRDKNLIDGIRLFRMKRWENALKEFLLADADSLEEEEQAELAYYTGLCYSKLQKYEDATGHLERVIDYGKDILRAYQCRMTLAYIYLVTGKAKMAEMELNRLQKSGFESAPLFNSLAYAAYAQKQYLSAIEFYEKTLEIDIDNATAMNSMGFILSDTGLDRVKGLKLCRKAVERGPKNAAYLDSLGWAHYKCGNITEAKTWLGRALDISPGHKEIKEHYKIVTAGGRSW